MNITLGRATIDEIIDAVYFLDRDDLERFYLNRVLPWDKRCIREILGGSETFGETIYNYNKTAVEETLNEKK